MSSYWLRDYLEYVYKHALLDLYLWSDYESSKNIMWCNQVILLYLKKKFYI